MCGSFNESNVWNIATSIDMMWRLHLITWHSWSNQQTSQSRKHWTLAHIQSRLMKSKTIQNKNNIKHKRNTKLITEIWTETTTFLLLLLKYHFLKSGQTRLCHNKKIINIILIINILQNQNQQCNKKVFNPSLGRRERETMRGGGWRRGKRGKKVTSKNKKRKEG